MKKLIKLCAMLLLFVAEHTQAANQSPYKEFLSCLEKNAPRGLLQEYAPHLLNDNDDDIKNDDGVINLDQMLHKAIRRHNEEVRRLKEAEVSGCANTLFKAYSAVPAHPSKSMHLRFASAYYKALRSLELGEIDNKGAAQAMLIARNELLQEVNAHNDKLLQKQQAEAQRKQQQDAQRAREEAYIRGMEEIERKYAAENNALIQGYIDRVNAERNRQSWSDAVRFFNEVTKPVIVPQPVDNSMNCRSYRNGNEIITNCR
jgi:hypothetical protein